MKKVAKVFVIAISILVIAKGCAYSIQEGIDKEMKRQCIVAHDMCEKYPDSCRDVETACEGVE